MKFKLVCTFTCLALLLQSLRAQEPPAILSISHVAVKAEDVEKSVGFYRDFLGFAESGRLKFKDDGSLMLVFMKVSDTQWIEIFDGRRLAQNDRLYQVCFRVADAEAMRAYLGRNGLSVPPKASRGQIQNVGFTVRDPQNYIVEFQQYTPEGWTARDQGKYLPPTRISDHIGHAGIVVSDLPAAQHFYEDLLGLKESWRGSKDGKVISWCHVKVPANRDFVEFMLETNVVPHFCLEVPDIEKAKAKLAATPYYSTHAKPLEVSVGKNHKRQLNLYDPEGIRVELMEPDTVDGKPVLPSLAPLPASQSIIQETADIDQARIFRLAKQALAMSPPTITDFVATNSAGGRHDYFSQADYAWPNPANPNGLPFSIRDGESNPNNFTGHRMALRKMKDGVAALAAAYALNGDDKYVIKAVALLQVFFLDPKTRMNPKLQYAQAILGQAAGTPYGIIDTLPLAELAVAIPFLEKSPAFPPAVDLGMKQWFRDYTQWILTSPNGGKERNSENNHSFACYVQLASFARLTGDDPLLAQARQHFKTVLLPHQMTNNGSFPRELRRTKPYGYSIFQADNLATLCTLLATTNEDLWKFTLPDGRQPRLGVDFIYPYLADKNKWLADGHRPDVMHWESWPVSQPCLLFAAVEFGEPKYFELWKRLAVAPGDQEVRRNQPITQPLLWIIRPEVVPLLK